MRPPRRILESVLYVEDLDAAAAFYGGVLGLEEASRKDGLFVFYRLEQAMLLLFEPDAARRWRNVPPHGAHGPGHLAFAVAEPELDAWRAHLAASGVDVEAEETWPGGGRSLYLRDPAGNSLEFATPRIWGWPDPGATEGG